MRIVVDAMGSDKNPAPDIEGAVLAARDYKEIEITLVGPENVIREELGKYDTLGLNIEVVHTDQVATMEDKPGRVGRTKPNSSMAVGMRLVKAGQAEAFVTAGNTGAALAYATLHELKRMDNVLRPVFPGILPIKDRRVILADSGANADCRPEWLVQFAIMCSAYADKVLQIKNPAVALLSNGEEEGKGNDLIRATAPLMANSELNFIGNVEPKDALHLKADVVIADGFTGNIFLKTLESMSELMLDLLREELTADIRSKLGAALAYPAFRRVYRQIDPFEIGGAPLLGVNGIVIVGHGRTNAKGIKNAINQARQAVLNNVLEIIRERMLVQKELPLMSDESTQTVPKQ
jgi:glycerol-3-phosphate acyltransferase PlsX